MTRPSPNSIPMDEVRFATITQFVADFFSGQAKHIDYSTLLPNYCWMDYVDAVVQAGGLLEDAIVKVRAENNDRMIDGWYDLLEASTDIFCRTLHEHGENWRALTVLEAFEKAARDHIERI